MGGAAPSGPPDLGNPAPGAPEIADGGTDTGSDAPAEAAAARCPEPLVWCDPLRPLPPTIAAAGFFPAAPDLAVLPPAAIRFEPRWPLWSDGLSKERQLYLPAGRSIDAGTDRQAWQFPAGTLFLKTFLAEGPNQIRRPVETRVLRRVESDDPFKQWEVAVYQWNEDGKDARLLDLQARVPTPVTVGGVRFQHQIPSRDDCLKCHEANDTMVIGFDEGRLNVALAGEAATQLEELHRRGVLAGAPPAMPEDIREDDADLAQLKAYVVGNCVHCHDGRNPTVVDMRPAALVEKLVCKPTTGSGTAAGKLVEPRHPERSIFYLQLARMSRPGINPMPPVGVQRADEPAVTLARRWIMSLPTSCP